MLFVTEAALERHERVVSGTPHVFGMKAAVATVTLHRSFTRLDRCAPLRTYLSFHTVTCDLSTFDLSTSSGVMIIILIIN